MNSKDIRNIIKNRRRELGLTMLDVAKYTGVSEATVSRWESGSIANMKRDKISLLADVLRLPLSAIMGSEEVQLPPNTIPIGSLGTLPVIGNVSAGNGALAYDDVLGYETVDKRYSNGDYFYLRVVGDSMSPKIENDDLVLVHKQSSVDSGNYAVVVVDDENGCVKKVKYDSDWIELHSINPYYPVRRFEGEDVLKIRVVGKVIEVKRKL